MQGLDLQELLKGYAARRTELDRFGAYFLRDINDEEAERFSKSLLLMAGERAGYPDKPLTIFINSGGGADFHTSSPQASAGRRYTADSRGRFKSTSNRDRRPTIRVGAMVVQRPVQGSSS